MSADIRLIVGLGNPGPEYEATRHNVGFWLLEELARIHRVSLSPESRFFGRTARLAPPFADTRLIAPATFMNKSGQSVGAIAQFFKIEPQQILVIHDELDLPAGVARFKTGGGHGGHNGLRDIIRALGNNQNFHRLRIGIDHPGHKDRVTGHVLGKPSAQDRERIEASIDASVKGIELALSEGWVKAKQYLHSIKADS